MGKRGGTRRDPAVRISGVAPRALVLGAALALGLLLALPARWVANAPARVTGSNDCGNDPGSQQAFDSTGPETEAIARLQARFGRPATTVAGDRRSRAVAQVSAIRAHLRRYPATGHAGFLYPWWALTELEVLDRPAEAARALDAWASTVGTGEDGLPTTLLRLRAQVLARTGDHAAETVVLKRLAARTQGAEHRLILGRLGEVRQRIGGCRLPWVGGRDLTGAEVGPAAWRGRVLLLDLWDPTAADAPARAAEVRALLATSAASGLVVVGVPLARNRAAVEAAVARLGVSWPQLFDPARPGNDHPVAGCLSPSGRRARLLVDRCGIIRGREQVGAELRAAIQVLLREEPPAGRDLGY